MRDKINKDKARENITKEYPREGTKIKPAASEPKILPTEEIA